MQICRSPLTQNVTTQNVTTHNLTKRIAKALTLLFLVSCAATLTPANTNAWGKRGHAIVCETAAHLASAEKHGEFLKDRSYDLGYYCNVPDLIWKRPATYKVEWTNHFMDMELFERATKESQVEKPYELSRVEFNKAFPKLKNEAGRAWWRIRELNSALDKISSTLKSTSIDLETRHKNQAEWLVHAGAIGHYIGDLAQPLHVTENYDGQLTGQKGIHSFYEDELVDELFSDPSSQLISEVAKSAAAKWKKSSGDLAKMSLLELLRSETEASNKALAALLKLDKSIGRKDIAKAAQAHREQIIERMAAGAVALAEIYRRQLGWKYNGNKFFTFFGEPEYIRPPQ